MESYTRSLVSSIGAPGTLYLVRMCGCLVCTAVLSHASGSKGVQVVCSSVHEPMLCEPKGTPASSISLKMKHLPASPRSSAPCSSSGS